MALPAIKSRYSRATAIWPGCPRTCVNALIEGRIAAFQRIHRHGAGDDGRGKHVFGAEQSGERQAVDTCVPLIKRQTLLGAQLEGLQARPGAGLRPRAAPRRARAPAPMPSSTVLKCAKGARSPEAPTEPCAGITGYTSCSSNASKASITAMVMPECPRASALILSARISRTTASGSASPTPAACESNRLRCRSSSCSVGYAGLGQQAESGIDSIRGIALGDDLVHQRAGHGDAAAIMRRQAQSNGVLVDPPQRRQVELRRRECRGMLVKGHSIIGRFRPCSRAQAMAVS